MIRTPYYAGSAAFGLWAAWHLTGWPSAVGLAVWVVGFTLAGSSIGAAVGKNAAARALRREIRREKARQDKELRRKYWTDHAQRKVGITAGDQKIMLDHGTMVHNHGPDEGRGLSCPEYADLQGNLRGQCLVDQAKTPGPWTPTTFAPKEYRL